MTTLASLCSTAGWAMLVGAVILATLRLLALAIEAMPLQVDWRGILLIALAGVVLWGLAKLLARG